jgi:hypothetical protein
LLDPNQKNTCLTKIRNIIQFLLCHWWKFNWSAFEHTTPSHNYHRIWKKKKRTGIKTSEEQIGENHRKGRAEQGGTKKTLEKKIEASDIGGGKEQERGLTKEEKHEPSLTGGEKPKSGLANAEEHETLFILPQKTWTRPRRCTHFTNLV